MKKISIFIFVISFVLCAKSQTYTLTDDDVVVENGVIQSCSYNFELKNIIIPETLDGQTIIGIADGNGIYHIEKGIFYNKGIASLKLPSTIQFIGIAAFYGNEIAHLDFSEGSALKSIRYNAFESNNISNTNISECIELDSIGGSAFKNNNLDTLDLSKCTKLKTIGYGAFHNNNLKFVEISGCKSLLYINSPFAYNSSLSGFHLPEVSYQGETYSFWRDGNGNNYQAGIDAATDPSTFYRPLIPYTLTDDDVVVEDGVIQSCSYNFELKNIIIPETLDGQTIIGIADGGIVGVYNFVTGIFYNKRIASIKLPSTIQFIGIAAFYENEITHLDFSEGSALKSIRHKAFDSNNISNTNISECIELDSIGGSAFKNNNLDTLDLSKCTKLKTIDYGAFQYNNLKFVDIRSCKRMLYINSPFINNPLSEFILPYPLIPGYFYSFWRDNYGYLYQAGVKVKNDVRILKRTMPEVSDVSPKYVPTNGNVEITITGQNFESAKKNKTITFNDIEALSYTSWSDTEIKVVCPPNPKGFFDIKINLLNGISYTSPKQLLYYDDDIVSVCGNVSGTWDSSKTYLLTCPCEVASDSNLTIEPGVTVIADHNSDEIVQLLINGTLNAIGTKQDSIIFKTLVPGNDHWDGIVFNSNKTRFLEFISVSNAKSGVTQLDGTLNINNCQFVNNNIGLNLDGNNKYITSNISNIITMNNNIGIYARAYCNDDDGRVNANITNSSIFKNRKKGIEIFAGGSTSGYTSTFSSSIVNFTIENSEISYNRGFSVDMDSRGYSVEGVPLDKRRYATIIFSSINNIFHNNANGFLMYRHDLDYSTLTGKLVNTTAYNNKTSFTLDADKWFVQNSIFWDNSMSSPPTGICDSLVVNNSNLNTLSWLTYGNNNISSNPLYISPETGDFHLQSISPCIDAGSNEFVNFETDFEGKIRIVDGSNNGVATVDMGAYEFISHHVGIFDQTLFSKIHVFPNPTNGIVKVGGLPENEEVIVSLYNITGTLITQFENYGSNAVIDLSKEPPGIYLIQVDGITRHTSKIIKE